MNEVNRRIESDVHEVFISKRYASSGIGKGENHIETDRQNVNDCDRGNETERCLCPLQQSMHGCPHSLSGVLPKLSKVVHHRLGHGRNRLT